MRSIACKSFAVFALLSVSGCSTIGGWLSDMSDWANETMPTYDGSRPGVSSNTAPEGRKSPSGSYGSSPSGSSSNYGAPSSSYGQPDPFGADPYANQQYAPQPYQPDYQPNYQPPYQDPYQDPYQGQQYQQPYQGQQYQPAPQQYQQPYQGQYQQPYYQQPPQQGYGGGGYESPMSREPDWDPAIPPPPGGIF